MIQYHNMADVLVDKKQGIAEIRHYEIKNDWYAMCYGITPGEYVQLKVYDELMMSNTDMEKRTSYEFMRNAIGNVLVCGLGIGMVILSLLEQENIVSITVIEKYQDVIDCVLPQIKKYDKHNKLTVICEDCFNYKPIKKYDTIFIDIWAYINSDIYKEEMLPLKCKYRNYLSKYGKITKNIFVWAEYQAKHNIKLI